MSYPYPHKCTRQSKLARIFFFRPFRSLAFVGVFFPSEVTKGWLAGTPSLYIYRRIVTGIELDWKWEWARKKLNVFAYTCVIVYDMRERFVCATCAQYATFKRTMASSLFQLQSRINFQITSLKYFLYFFPLNLI